jgi:hypothetical protein
MSNYYAIFETILSSIVKNFIEPEASNLNDREKSTHSDIEGNYSLPVSLPVESANLNKYFKDNDDNV